MQDPESAYCEVKIQGRWERISLADALRLDQSRIKRCPECRGQVRAHKHANNGMRAHFEHFIAHLGCPLTEGHSGPTIPHPRIVL